MDKNQKQTLLLKSQIESVKKENRYLEFKSNYQDAHKLGQYVSALNILSKLKTKGVIDNNTRGNISEWRLVEFRSDLQKYRYVFMLIQHLINADFSIWELFIKQLRFIYSNMHKQNTSTLVKTNLGGSKLLGFNDAYFRLVVPYVYLRCLILIVRFPFQWFVRV